MYIYLYVSLLVPYSAILYFHISMYMYIYISAY